MSAKQKLNIAVINGALIVAGVIGWLTNSFAIFVGIAIILIAGSIYCRDIRR